MESPVCGCIFDVGDGHAIKRLRTHLQMTIVDGSEGNSLFQEGNNK